MRRRRQELNTGPSKASFSYGVNYDEGSPVVPGYSLSSFKATGWFQVAWLQHGIFPLKILALNQKYS